jgi:aspartate/methionine/tyrosine aminotransferase
VKLFEQRNQYFDSLVSQTSLKWLGQNTNHFPAHPNVKQAILDSVESEEWHAYAPPLGLEELRNAVIADLGLSGQSAFITDGAVEALYAACRNLSTPGTNFVTTDPGWKWPMRFAEVSGATVREIPIYDAKGGYRLSPEQLDAAVDQNTSVIYLVDPNNPLGVCYSEDEIRAFTDIARKANAYFVHDSTYRDFADQHVLAARFYPERTITILSFSKWLGLAGMRLGALVAQPEIVEMLAAAPPNNLGSNLLSQRAAIAGLKVKAQWMEDINKRQRANQQRIKDTCDAIPGLFIPVFPSQANFLVVETIDAGVTPEALCQVLSEHGIMIRQGAYHTASAGHRFVKISTTVPEQWVDDLCRALPAAVEKAKEVKAVKNLF